MYQWRGAGYLSRLQTLDSGGGTLLRSARSYMLLPTTMCSLIFLYCM